MAEHEALGTTTRDEAEFAHQTWPADPRALAALRSEVRRWLAPLNLTVEAEQDLVLAVSEAASNAIEHAYPAGSRDETVDLTFWTEPAAVCIEVVDHGHWQAPSSRRTGRGLGITIMQRLVGSVLIHYDARGTRVLLRHPLPGDALVLTT